MVLWKAMRQKHLVNGEEDATVAYEDGPLVAF